MKLWSKIITAICTLLIVWAVGSTLEIAHKSLKPNPQYSPANLWILVLDTTEGVQ